MTYSLRWDGQSPAYPPNASLIYPGKKCNLWPKIDSTSLLTQQKQTSQQKPTNYSSKWSLSLLLSPSLETKVNFSQTSWPHLKETKLPNDLNLSTSLLPILHDSIYHSTTYLLSQPPLEPPTESPPQLPTLPTPCPKPPP